jgi:ankyrin repeat protein
LLAGACLLASCDSPEKKALRALSKLGVDPNGKALLEAAEKGDSPMVKLLLQAGVHNGQRDSSGRTPLRIAVDRHDLGTAFLLLDQGADPNAIDSSGVCILGSALAAGETAIIERLLDKGAKADGKMPGGEAVLPWAIREGRLAFVSRVMSTGVDPHMKDAAGNSLVHVAMQTGRRELMTTLLDRGADGSGLDAKGASLLQRAMEHEWLDLVPKLVKAGADPNALDSRGVRPLEDAIHRRELALLDLFLSVGGDPNLPNKDGDTAVHLVLRARWNEGRAALAKAKADFNLPDAKGMTPLTLALNSNDLDLAEDLIHAGATPLSGGWDRWFTKALSTGDVSMMRRLLRLGVRADERDHYGRLPVESATHLKQGSMVRALIDAGAPAGDSLYLACRRGERGMAEILMTSGISPNPSRAPWLDTPLGAAIRSRNVSLVEELIEQGADPHLPTAEGQLPIHLAIALRQPEMVRLFLSCGASANAPFILPVRSAFLDQVKSKTMRWVLKSDRNITPLMLAASCGEPETARLLIRAGAKQEAIARVTRFTPINFASSMGDIRMMRTLLGRDPKFEERTIVISLSEQRARVYNGLGQEIYTTKVSTGKPGFATPTGEFAITNKHRDWTSTLYHASMPFFQRLSCADFGLHQGVVPGYPASHGCIRVPAAAAAKLFTMTQTGDRVKIIP